MVHRAASLGILGLLDTAKKMGIRVDFGMSSWSFMATRSGKSENESVAGRCSRRGYLNQPREKIDTQKYINSRSFYLFNWSELGYLCKNYSSFRKKQNRCLEHRVNL